MRFIAFIFALAVVLSGCVEKQIHHKKHRQEEVAEATQLPTPPPNFKATCPKGSSKDCVLSFLGAPENVKKLAGYEIWSYTGPTARSCQVFFNARGVTDKYKCFPTRKSQAIIESRDAGQEEAIMWPRQQSDAATYEAIHRIAGSASSPIPPSGCIGVAPVAPVACHMACINGAWQSVCH